MPHQNNILMKKKYIKDLTENEGIHAPTIEIAEKLCKRFDELGLKWRTHQSYLTRTEFDSYEGDTCYNPVGGGYCSKEYYLSEGFAIYTISDLLDFEDSPEDTNSLPISKVVFFELKKGKYIASNGSEVTTEFILKRKHSIFNHFGYVVIE